MRNTTAAVLEPVGKARIALEAVDFQASLRGLMSEVVVTQTYRNLENASIEAVYTFPLPFDAVLLELTLELNGKMLHGVIYPNTDAEDRYEDAINDGDSAILLQKLEPGIFTLNAGNILPGEKAVVRFRYAQLHHWQGDSLKFHIPTTIAPRYGDPYAAGLSPHQVPEYVLSADYAFSLVVRIKGELSQAKLDCPSHQIAISRSSDVMKISLSGGSAMMDRDFVLVVKEPVESVEEGFLAQDNEQFVALASFHPTFPEDTEKAPRCIKLVVDCSGSMNGDSIVEAITALREIISLLKPVDYFNLIRFGSSYGMLFPEVVIANQENISKATQFVHRLLADMGGTEIGAALDAAYRSGTIAGLPSDLLLITDGEVWHHEQVIRDAQESGHRIFTVGVGSAVSESFVRGIAESTSGACEVVSPHENMSEHIIRHFRRIDQPKANSLYINWPKTPICQIPAELGTVYAGDTLHVFGWFDERPAGTVDLTVTFGDGRVVVEKVNLPTEFNVSESSFANLPRIAAHSRLQVLDADAATELAKRYQLVTEHTSCVLVYDREESEKSEGIPVFRKVPQILAAGWGGMGDVVYRLADPIESRYGHKELIHEKMVAHANPPSMMAKHADFKLDDDGSMELARFLTSLPQDTNDFSHLVSALNTLYSERTSTKLDITALSDLIALGLDQEIADRLSRLINTEEPELDVIIAFLSALSDSDAGNNLSRHVKRLIRRAEKQLSFDMSRKETIRQIITDEKRSLSDEV